MKHDLKHWNRSSLWSLEAEETISIPWERALEGRRVAQWGVRYDYTNQAPANTKRGCQPDAFSKKWSFVDGKINCKINSDAGYSWLFSISWLWVIDQE